MYHNKNRKKEACTEITESKRGYKKICMTMLLINEENLRQNLKIKNEDI